MNILVIENSYSFVELKNTHLSNLKIYYSYYVGTRKITHLTRIFVYQKVIYRDPAIYIVICITTVPIYCANINHTVIFFITEQTY